MKQGKRYSAIREKLEVNKIYSVTEACTLICDQQKVKFDETVEVHMKLGIDPKKGDQQVRGSVVLPHGVGKEKKVAVITITAMAEAKKAGADFVGGEDSIAMIHSGKFFEGGYDVLVATPEMMPKLAPVAKILGPRGLMPSPKTETVTTKVADTIAMIKKGKVNFKNDSLANMHQSIGKVSFGPVKLEENLSAFLDALNKVKPASLKGKFIVSATVCSTMGPGMRISF